MRKNCKEILTIRNIINSLNDIMTGSSNITLDSPVIIADANTMQEFDDIRIYPIRDVFYGEDKVGIYVRPKKVEYNYEEEKEIIQQGILGKEREEEARLGNSEVTEEQVLLQASNWWEKYK